MNNICIIPARSGSKRIKNKNLKTFFNKPLIYWTIKSALKSKLFNEVIVSTNDKKISKYALKYGAAVPFLRSKKNSSDSATVHSAIIETIQRLLNKNYKIDNICCLLPTAVLVNQNHIKKSYIQFSKNKNKFLIGITKFPSPPQKGFILNKRSKIKLYQKKKLFNKSQNYKTVFYDAGQIYWGSAHNYLRYKNFRKIYDNKAQGFVLDENEIQDIDTLKDFEMAKIKFEFNKKTTNA